MKTYLSNALVILIATAAVGVHGARLWPSAQQQRRRRLQAHLFPARPAAQ